MNVATADFSFDCDVDCLGRLYLGLHVNVTAQNNLIKSTDQKTYLILNQNEEEML